MQWRQKFLLSGLLVSFLGFGCGGPVGTVNSGGTSVAGGAKTVDLDLSSADVTKKSATSSESLAPSVSQSVGKAEGLVSKSFGTAVGDDCRAGCEARRLIDEGIRMSKQAAIFECYRRTCEEKIPEFTCASPDFGHYRFGITDGGPAGADFAMLVRCRTVGDTVTVDICEGGKHTEHFGVTNTTSSRTFTYDMKHHFTSAKQGQEGGEFCDFDGNGTVSDQEQANCRSAGSSDEWSTLNGTVVYDATATGVIDSFDELDSATITGVFDGNFGNGDMTFTQDEDGSPTGGSFNTGLGCFAQSLGAADSGTGCMYTELNSAQGSAKFSWTGAMPCMQGLPTGLSGCLCPQAFSNACDPTTKFATADCRVANPAADCYCLVASTTGNCVMSDTGTEHFTISLNSSGKPVFKIATTSIFAANVTAKTLPTSPATITKNFGGNAWDCTAPSGFTLINIPDETIFAACHAKEQEAFASGDRDNCSQDAQEQHIAEGTAAAASLGLAP